MRLENKLANSYMIHNNLITDYDSQSKGTSHKLMELSERQWKRLSKNSIILSGMIVDNTIKQNSQITYENISYGEHIILIKRKTILSGAKSFLE